MTKKRKMQKYKTCSSFNVQIWCGLKEGYDGKIHDISEVQTICQNYVNNKKECVTVTATNFVYVDGAEPGVCVGFIRYPRFPHSEMEIQGRAIELAEILMKTLNQNRVTVTTPSMSYMLENTIEETK